MNPYRDQLSIGNTALGEITARIIPLTIGHSLDTCVIEAYVPFNLPFSL